MIRWMRLGGTALACLSLVAALTLPRIPRERAMPDAIAIVDITQSMNVLDETIDGQPVSRLVFVKSALSRAVWQLPCGSRLGLGIFTEFRSVVLLLPVDSCLDRRELLDAIGAIDGRMAWAGGSEIAKGLYLSVRTFASLNPAPTLAFITDGHEAPPVDPRHPIDLAGDAGRIQGLLVGVGGLKAAAIPKVDPEGNPAGFWGPDDVMQESLYAHGRQGSVPNEAMAEEPGAAPTTGAALRGTPGEEHLSSLREAYLQALAAQAKFGYARLDDVSRLAALLDDRRFDQPTRVVADLRWVAGSLALLGLCLPHAGRLLSRLRLN